ncbi:MAG: SUMF1/EgtB/PvdO family nonheme iron enzyme, partial [Kiritimatiellales bacterium]
VRHAPGLRLKDADVGELDLALVALCGMAQAGFVTISNANNTADTTGYGAVGYNYQISKTEVTIAEMQAATGAGSGNENYWNNGARTVGTAAPASYVSLYEAMKYCNWMTSGNVNSGLYEDKGGGVWGAKMTRAAVMAGSTLYYAVPTENEWYKAAYFKPDASGYSLYANGTANIPTHGTTDGWNYYNSGYVNGSPNYTWTAGYGGAEQNGTYDMMGNVWEWMETSSGVLRGGSCDGLEYDLRSSNRFYYNPALEYDSFGFRVVAIPEPATALSLVLGGLVVTGYRRMRKSYGHF